MPVASTTVEMYRNNQAGPTVLSSDPKGTEYVEWQGHGDPNGGDIQPVSPHMQSLPTFQRCVRRGILEHVPEDSPLLSEAMDAQQQHWDSRMSQTADAAAAAIDHATNNDVVVLPCVGPSPRGGTTCGADVPVRDNQQGEKAPLCNLHTDLAPQFVPEDVIENGKSVKKWTRVTMGARERQQ